MILRKIASATIALLLLAAGAQPAQAARWSPARPDMNSLGVNISESVMESTGGTSQILAMERIAPGTSGMPNQSLCNELGPECSPAPDQGVNATLILPPCQEISAVNCIEDLVFTNLTTRETSTGQLIRSVAGPTVSAKPEWGVPEGGTTSLWKVPGFANKGGTDTYSITAQVGLGTNGKIYNVTNLNATIYPYSEQSGSYKTIKFNEFKHQNGVNAVGTEGWDPACAWTESGICGQFEDFADDVSVSLVLRVDTSLGGWYKGRLEAADIAIKALSKAQNRITFSGRPVEVPMFAFSKPISQATESELAYVKGAAGWIGGWLGNRSDSTQAFKALETFRDSANDTATAVITTWSVGAIGAGSSPCFSDRTKVHGLVTTNSMVYQPSAPEFKAGTLSYQVAGTHYLPGGEELAKGSYELVVRAETARCLYGFSNAPVSASVSVSGSDNVATTVLSEKNGWLKLSAKGFTFSTKTIKVKLTQKKTTITCVTTKKPTKTKKVTALNPKCPSGYKKK